MNKYILVAVAVLSFLSVISCGENSKRIPIRMSDRNAGFAAALDLDNTTHKVGTEDEARYCLKVDSLVSQLKSKYPGVEARSYISDLRLLAEKRTEQEDLKAFDNRVAQSRALELNSELFDPLIYDNLENIEGLLGMESLKQEACDTLSFMSGGEKLTFKIDSDTYTKDSLNLYSPETNNTILRIERNSINGLKIVQFGSMSLAELNESKKLEKCKIEAEQDELALIVVHLVEWGDLGRDIKVSAELLSSFNRNFRKFSKVEEKLNPGNKGGKQSKDKKRQKLSSSRDILISHGIYSKYVEELTRKTSDDAGETVNAFSTKCD